MAALESLHDAFIDELRDAYDAEKQLMKALPRMAGAATSESLRLALDHQLAETETQVAHLEGVLQSLAVSERRKRCDGIAGILAEVTVLIDDGADEATLDACLVASGQRVGHFGIAAYGTLAAWARTIGHDQAADVLDGILAQKKAVDQTLSALGRNGINTAAARSAPDDDALHQSLFQPASDVASARATHP